MKPAHSREMLCSIEYFPFEDEVLNILVNSNERSGLIYLTYQCICRYLNMFSQTYNFPTDCDVERILLTKKFIFDMDRACEFFEDSEYNSSNLLYQLAAYCDWDYISLTEQELRDVGLNLEIEIPLETQIKNVESLREWAKELLKRFPVNVESTLMDETGTVNVLHIKGVREYRQYRKRNLEIIQQDFLREDRIISSILKEADDVMINDTITESVNEETEEFLLSWTTGCDGYYYYSIGNLSPNWLISMYVLHGLLEHAQLLFGYGTGGNKDND